MRALDVLARLEAALAPASSVAPAASAEVRDAAVAVIFRVGAGDSLELLMIERASYAGDPWSGHVAFPGGRREPHDAALAEHRHDACDAEFCRLLHDEIHTIAPRDALQQGQREG